MSRIERLSAAVDSAPIPATDVNYSLSLELTCRHRLSDCVACIKQHNRYIYRVAFLRHHQLTMKNVSMNIFNLTVIS